MAVQNRHSWFTKHYIHVVACSPASVTELCHLKWPNSLSLCQYGLIPRLFRGCSQIFSTSGVIMISPCDSNLLPLSVTKYLPLQLPTSILVYGGLHNLIFHDHFVEKCHSWRPPKHHDDAMHGKIFLWMPLYCGRNRRCMDEKSLTHKSLATNVDWQLLASYLDCCSLDPWPFLLTHARPWSSGVQTTLYSAHLPSPTCQGCKSEVLSDWELQGLALQALLYSLTAESLDFNFH